MRSWKKPTPEQVARAVALLSRAEQRRYFFDRLGNPEWIASLRELGFFAVPPSAIKNPDDGSVRFPPWPESRFLARVAGEAPELVKDVILASQATDNVAIHEDILDAALAMPAVNAVEIAVKETVWLQSIHQLLSFLMPEKFGALTSHLANGGEARAALELARVLLMVLPDPKPGAFGEPQVRMDEWDYQQVLEKNVPDCVTAAPGASLMLLCDLLRDAVEKSLRDTNPQTASDSSIVWRHAVEDSPQDLWLNVQGVKGLLVSALRDTAERVVGSRVVAVADAVSRLEAYQWPIFRRIALHVLRRFPEGAQDLIAERLLEAGRLTDPYDTRVLHEYALLLCEQFAQLLGEQQAMILGWIEQGPDLQRLKVRYEENGQLFTGQRAELYQKHWQLNRLALIDKDLPPKSRELYDRLVGELGEPEHPDFQSYSSGVKTGPTSAISAAEIASLTTDEIVARIVAFDGAWTSGGDIDAPSPGGLSRELSTAVSANPERFASEVSRFRQLPPTYVRGLLSGFDQAARQNRPFDWAPVLDLSRWVVEQPRAGTSEPAQVVSDPFDVDRDWTRARSAVAHLLSAGFGDEKCEPPFQLRDIAWKALSPLTIDPEPDEDYESKYLQGSGPAHISINTIRGEALHAVIRYALWVRRHLKQMRTDDGPIAPGLDAMPEVRNVLDAHLDVRDDPSLAIRSVYGQWFPWLNLIDEKWAIANAPRIFPADDALRRHWSAAWSTYVIFSPLYDNVFEVLRAEYDRAIERLGDADVNLERIKRADDQLAEHLILLYGRGRISLDESSPILRFFERAEVRVRAHAVSHAGWVLGREQEAIPQEVVDRLMRLWELRLQSTRTTPNAHRAELSAFSSWFTSRKFPHEWGLTQLSTVLRLIGDLERDYDVPKRLAELASEYPFQTVECLRLMIDGKKESWQIHTWREDARKLLESAKQRGDPTVVDAVDQVVNELGARGFFDFRDLAS